jgi:hypothetical protein
MKTGIHIVKKIGGFQLFKGGQQKPDRGRSKGWTLKLGKMEDLVVNLKNKS